MPSISNVDINELSLLDEVVEVDGQALSEEFFQPPIPDDGEHDAVLYLGDRGITVERQRAGKGGPKTGPAYLNVHVQAKILNDQGAESMSCFDNLTTIVMQGQMNSRLHAVMDLTGNKLPDRATLGQIKELVEQALAQNPRVKITTQWIAQINRGTKDKPDYADIAKGQRRFPPVIDEATGQPSGKYSRDIQDPKSGEVVSAQVKITKYARP